MIAHTSVAVRDLQASRAFYEKALASLRYEVNMDLTEYGAVGFGEGSTADFWIGKSEESSGGVHVAFKANNQQEVDQFHAVAITAGATDNGAPGYRLEYSPGYYAAFVKDLDGNNIEAVWMDPSKI